MVKKIVLALAGLLILIIVVYVGYVRTVGNERVAAEIVDDPNGTRAARVTLLTFADGKQIPVNYLLEDKKVFVGADGPWWREFTDGGAPVTVLIKGETLSGQAVAIVDNKAYTDDVFSRLRPTVPAWLPDWANGTLVEITLK